MRRNNKAKKSPTEQSRMIKNLKLDLEIMRSQKHTWDLRAKKKQLRIKELERQIR